MSTKGVSKRDLLALLQKTEKKLEIAEYYLFKCRIAVFTLATVAIILIFI